MSKSNESASRTRFGRSLFLKGVGAAALGVTIPSVFAQKASAAPPYPCYGYNKCSCCYKDSCCVSGCSAVSTCHGTSCWYTTVGGVKYRCCDWKHGSTYCICSTSNLTGIAPEDLPVVAPGTRP